jgi:ATP-dependent Clp protease ATP-binding subunit ClpA
LDEISLKKIVENEMSKLVMRLKEKNFEITFDKTVTNRVVELNKQEEYGARPIKRIIQNLLEDYISEEILKDKITENISYMIKYKDDELRILKK